VHAWIATVALWNNQRRPPASPAHTFNRHGPTAAGNDHWLSVDTRGEAWDGDNYMLDPGHPDAARYMADVAVELASSYDVDGVHLDLVRYAGAQMGYNPTSLARYRRRFGITAGADPPSRSDPRWQQWRRDQVTALVRRIYLDCLAVKPGLKVIASVIGWGSGPVDDRTWRGTSAYGDVFQDWLGWLQEGIVDVALPMNYDDEANPEQRAWFDRWLAWERTHQGKRHVAPGVGLFLNAPEAGLSQVRRALAPGPGGERLAGVALYSYAVTNAPPKGSELPTTPNAQFYPWLSGAPAPSGAPSPAPGEPPFVGLAVPPDMPWKRTPGAFVRGAAIFQGEPLDGASVRLDGPGGTSVTLQTDGNGYFGAPDLPPGAYTATLMDGATVRARAAVDLPAGVVTTMTLSS
jgi:hypothetical protein